jgi:small subunit ribosomal protein S18
MRIDYKDVSMLSHYISSRGKIESRHRTKACAKHQRRLAQAIKRARFLALLPYAPKHIWETGGVGLRRTIS